MALRKPLAFTAVSPYAHHEEIPITDTIQLAGMTLTGDLAFSGGTAKITGMAAASGSGQALAYGQSGASLAGLTTTNGLTVSGGAVALGGGTITGVGTPSAGTDAANKAYVDTAISGVATGLSWKSDAIVVAVANQATMTGLAQTIDGVALNTIGMRVLLTAQSTPAQNGLWTVQSGAWSRPTDYATGGDGSSAACIVDQGTVYQNTLWMCTTNTGSAVIDTNDLVWVRMPLGSDVLAGGGLSKTGLTISVKKGDGIEIVSNGASTNVALTVANPGLQLEGSSPNKTLNTKLSSTGGLETDANGLKVKLNGATLALAAGGASVAGVPSTFSINGTAVSANVTAANLNTLTAGVASNADALHTHAAVGAATAAAVTLSKTTDDTLVAGDPVYIKSNGNFGKAAANADGTAIVIGVTPAGVSIAASATVVAEGIVGGLSGATPGVPYYLGATGALVTTAPATGRIIQVGVAASATQLWVDIKDYGKR